MRILLAHNFYQSSAPSGEDVVYRNERSLLENAGHEVTAFERHNDGITTSIAARTRAAVDSVWSNRTYAELRAQIRQRRPDVAHFHNTFPLITPSAYRACHDEGVPVVQTLHNYRLVCPGGLLMRNARPCEQCLDSSFLHAVQHACYRNSRLATATVVAGLQVNRALGSYSRYVDRYIALTGFAKQRLVRGGLPADRIVIRPNGLEHAPQMGSGDGGYALYVGRLTPEKGAETLLRAWQSIDSLPLRIVGDGSLRARLESQYSRPNIAFLGFQPRAEVWAQMQRAALVVIPSECYEGFPITVLEAFAAGAPVIASRIGALDEIVDDPDNGQKFEPGDPASLQAAIHRSLADVKGLHATRLRNRRCFEQRYDAKSSLESLQAIYGTVIAAKHANDAVSLRNRHLESSAT